MFAAHPTILVVGSALFLVLTIWMCAAHGWRLGETVGHGFRSAPLWVVALVGLPLWSLGVVVGVRRVVAGTKRDGARRGSSRIEPAVGEQRRVEQPRTDPAEQ